jgi:hypothetical protein
MTVAEMIALLQAMPQGSEVMITDKDDCLVAATVSEAMIDLSDTDGLPAEERIETPFVLVKAEPTEQAE